MKRKWKKLLSLSLVLVMSIFVLAPTSVNANDVVQEEVQENKAVSVEEILNEYCAKLELYSLKSNINTFSKTTETKEIIKQQTIEKLTEAGYEAYDVNSNTFDEVEEQLSTDLEDINLNRNYSYIIVLEGESKSSNLDERMFNNNVSPTSSTGTSFSYTSGGTTYTMRYMTVTAADDPAFAKTSEYNLLSNPTQKALENCLNAALEIYVSAIWAPLGTISTLWGLDISDFKSPGSTRMEYIGNTNWTRVFTQVWDKTYSQWMNGSCVEYVRIRSRIDGDYYNATVNAIISFPEEEKVNIKYSNEYLDYTWRKEKAVYGFENYWTQYDLTGNIKYRHDGKVIITHYENF